MCVCVCVRERETERERKLEQIKRSEQRLACFIIETRPSLSSCLRNIFASLRISTKKTVLPSVPSHFFLPVGLNTVFNNDRVVMGFNEEDL